MLHILICDDDPKQRARIEAIVRKQLISDEADMKLAGSADNPSALLKYLENHRIQSGLYFLDVDLQSDLHGFELAAEIRKLDVSATIVFITSFAERIQEVFQYRVEAMDYIVKSDSAEEVERRVIECIQLAYARYLRGKHSNDKFFPVKAGDQTLNIPYDDILFFETSTEFRHRVLLHRKNDSTEFYGKISEIEKLGPPFFRCHHSFVVNVKHVRRVDTTRREAEMVNGETIPIAVRRMKGLLKCMG